MEKGFDPFDERDVGRPVSLTAARAGKRQCEVLHQRHDTRERESSDRCVDYLSISMTQCSLLNGQISSTQQYNRY